MITITSFLLWAEHVVFTLVILWAVQTAFLHGLGGLVGQLLRFLKLTVPGVDSLIKSTLQNEVQGFINQVKSDPSRTSGQTQAAAKRIVVIPKTGIPPAELLKEMNAMKEREVAVMEEGKIFAYVYTQENDKLEQVQLEAFNLYTEQPQLSTHHDKLVLEAHHAFLHENALSPMVFPSLRKFETEVISMSANMLHGDGHVVGSLTSGGTESILMAVKTYRDRARKLFPHIKVPNMVAPVTIHPAFVKAAHYFGLELVTVAVDQRSQRPDMVEYEQAITAQTILLLASAPQYCHGIVDPIPAISEIAVRRGLPLHVDACVGGYMLPWVEKLGYQVPAFDFRLPGVTSMSADLHKYGYTFKGASVVLYRSEELRKYQIFAYSGWPGGLFGSPSMAGSRPGGTIAAAWAAMRVLGEDGYTDIARQLMNARDKVLDAVRNIPSLQVVGEPHMTIFALMSADPKFDILVLADILENKGWKIERQQLPNSIHFTLMPHHLNVLDGFIADLKTAAEEVKANPGQSAGGTAAMYGMMAKIPDKGIIDDFIVEFFSEMYKN